MAEHSSNSAIQDGVLIQVYCVILMNDIDLLSFILFSYANNVTHS